MAADFKSHILSRDEKGFGGIPFKRLLFGGIAGGLTYTVFRLALGYGENPPGPRTPAEGLASFDLLPGQAADITLTWRWQGEPYGSFGVGAWRFALQF